MIHVFKTELAEQLVEAIHVFSAERGTDLSLSANELLIETPPDPTLGDVSFPMYPLARIFKMPPPAIASHLSALLADRGLNAQAAGPYINIYLNREKSTERTITSLKKAGDSYGSNSKRAGERITLEFSSPNTNKPLHLGHLRNNAFGESVSRILAANGANVRKVNLINDRGVHICKSMLAYKEKGEGQSPEQEGMKPDHFVGKYYVVFNEMLQADPTVEKRAQEMLKLWEENNEEVRSLWKTMNGWAMEGLQASYERTGIHFDAIYHESDTYMLGRDYILSGLDKGLFYKDNDGTIWADLDDIGLERKVLLRRDGTSVYITQDIGTAISRYKDWSFDRMFYVVANEQNYHFRVLFHLLKTLGMEWAENLVHLSYGMVNLPDGKMKSREGTVVDADDLLDTLHSLALKEIEKRGRDSDLGNPEQTAEAVALAAVHYYLLQVSPAKDMIFNPEESLSFNGNTGPYLQYMGARISSMLRKYRGELGELPDASSISWGLLKEDIEWDIVKHISRFPEIVESAGRNYDPSCITSYLYELGKTFSRFYHEHPVLGCPQSELRDARIYVAWAVQEVLKRGFALINIPFLEEM